MKNNHLLQNFIFFIFFVFATTNVSAQQNAGEVQQMEDAIYLFTELKRICDKDNGNLWGKNLYCPFLLINKDNRFFVANDSLPVDRCEKNGIFFIGYLPNIYAISNSTLKIGEKEYASVRYSNQKQLDTAFYLQTFIHEMFHIFIESYSKHKNSSYNNPHMDTKYGRIYLQLELLALKKAFTSSRKEQKRAIMDALCFRNKRQSIFPNAKENENNFEIQEGLPTYTEFRLGIFSAKKQMYTLLNRIDELINDKSYMRSFGYETGAAYAFLNDNKSNDWRKAIFTENNLSKMTMLIYHINPKETDTINFNKYITRYDYQSIFAKEDSLENIREAFKKDIIEKLNHTTLLVVDLDHNSFSGFTSGMIQLDDIGTYYPYMNLSGKFGYIYSKKACIIKWKEDKCFLFLDNVVIEDNKSNSKEIEMEINTDWEIKKDGRFYKLTYVK